LSVTDRIARVCVFAALLIFFLGAYALAEKQKIQVTSEKASIHLWADTESRIIAHISSGTVLISEYREGEWHRVNFRPTEDSVMKSGFIHQRDIRKLEEEKKKQPQIFISGISAITMEDIGYEGQPVSLKFRDADIRDVIAFLCDVGGWSVVFDPGVSGKISCELRDVPWDQALDVICKTRRLGKTAEGKVFRIARIKDLINR